MVFNNGHAATWKKAKKSHVKLVSVLWIGRYVCMTLLVLNQCSFFSVCIVWRHNAAEMMYRCHDDAVLVDEELYPAINDESNLVLRNKQVSRFFLSL